MELSASEIWAHALAAARTYLPEQSFQTWLSGTEAVGFGFGADVGELSGALDAGDAVVLVEVLERDEATREGFEEVRDAVVGQLGFERSQQYVQKWLVALREDTVVEDHRERLLLQQEAQPMIPGF